MTTDTSHDKVRGAITEHRLSALELKALPEMPRMRRYVSDLATANPQR